MGVSCKKAAFEDKNTAKEISFFLTCAFEETIAKAV